MIFLIQLHARMNLSQTPDRVTETMTTSDNWEPCQVHIFLCIQVSQSHLPLLQLKDYPYFCAPCAPASLSTEEKKSLDRKSQHCFIYQTL
jgi:hypothetical protein